VALNFVNIYFINVKFANMTIPNKNTDTSNDAAAAISAGLTEVQGSAVLEAIVGGRGFSQSFNPV